MKTRREIWDAHEPNRANLEALLLNPTLRAALDVLVFDWLPESGTVPLTDVAANAHLNAKREGFYDFYHALLNLIEGPPTPAQPLPPGWAYKRKAQEPSTPKPQTRSK